MHLQRLSALHCTNSLDQHTFPYAIVFEKANAADNVDVCNCKPNADGEPSCGESCQNRLMYVSVLICTSDLFGAFAVLTDKILYSLRKEGKNIGEKIQAKQSSATTLCCSGNLSLNLLDVTLHALKGNFLRVLGHAGSLNARQQNVRAAKRAVTDASRTVKHWQMLSADSKPNTRVSALLQSVASQPALSSSNTTAKS